MTQSAHRVLSLAGGHTFLIYRKVLRRGGIIISINNDNQVVIALVNSSNANRCSIGQNPELQLPKLSIGSCRLAGQNVESLLAAVTALAFVNPHSWTALFSKPPCRGN